MGSQPPVGKLGAAGPAEAPAGEEEDEDYDPEVAKGATGSLKGEVDIASMPMVPMAYGSTARPAIKGVANLVAEQPVELIVNDISDGPTPESPTAPLRNVLRRRRFIFVGDVHGQRKPLDELLDKIDFDAGNDHLVLTGDLVNKGPDSAGVVQLVMDLGASAVRGNHEDRVLLAYESLRSTKTQPRPAAAAHAPTTAAEEGEEPEKVVKLASIEAEGKMARASAMLQREEDIKKKGLGILAFLGLRRPSEEEIVDHVKAVAELDIDPLEQNPFSHGDAIDRATAASLTPEQAQWLGELPVILHIGRIAPPPSAVSNAAASANVNAPFHDVVVVHAGLVPGLPMERQDPYAAMVMRSLVHPADEVRFARARLIAAQKIRARSWGRIKPIQRIDVPKRNTEAEYRKLQQAVYGPDLKHPRQPVPLGSPRHPIGDSPEAPNLVLLPIEGHFREGHGRIHWAAAWNQAQHDIPTPENRTTVIYGHDAITGLLVPQAPSSGLLGMLSSAETDTGYTFGLDSGAVYGGKLTALIVEAARDGRIKHRIEQVSCPKASKSKAAP